MDKRNMTAKQIVTIPNLLSLFRIALIPVMLHAYCVRHDPVMTGNLLILSGLTDVVDGCIARRFHMVSDLGKVLDPLADKLTQVAMLICLAVRFPQMIVPLALLIVKETFMAVSGYLVIRRTGSVPGANWHGKAATCLLYLTMFVHVFASELPGWISGATVAASSAMIALSLVLYAIRNMKMIRRAAP